MRNVVDVTSCSRGPSRIEIQPRGSNDVSQSSESEDNVRRLQGQQECGSWLPLEAAGGCPVQQCQSLQQQLHALPRLGNISRDRTR